MLVRHGGWHRPGAAFRAPWVLPGVSVVAVVAVLLLLLSLVLGCSLMLFVRLRLGLTCAELFQRDAMVRLLGAVSCFDSAALVHIRCFLPLPAALGLTSVISFCVDGLCSRAGSLSWSVPFGFPAVGCAATTCSHQGVIL